jgi:hypothetical protein
VLVPVLVPLIITDTACKGFPTESVILPRIVLFCDFAVIPMRKKMEMFRTKEKFFNLIF